MSYYCYAHNWASPTYSCPQCHKLHYSASSDSVPSVFTGTVTPSPAQVKAQSVEDEAIKQAEGAKAAIAYMTKYENYVEGYMRGHEAAQARAVENSHAKTERMAVLKDKLKRAGALITVAIGDIERRMNSDDLCDHPYDEDLAELLMSLKAFREEK